MKSKGGKVKVIREYRNVPQGATIKKDSTLGNFPLAMPNGKEPSRLRRQGKDLIDSGKNLAGFPLQ